MDLTLSVLTMQSICKNITSHIWWQVGDRCVFHCLALLPLLFRFRSDESPAAQAQSYNLSNPLSAWCDNVISFSSLFCWWLMSHNLYCLSTTWWIVWVRVWLLQVFKGCRHCGPEAAGRRYSVWLTLAALKKKKKIKISFWISIYVRGLRLIWIETVSVCPN